MEIGPKQSIQAEKQQHIRAALEFNHAVVVAGKIVSGEVVDIQECAQDLLRIAGVFALETPFLLLMP